VLIIAVPSDPRKHPRQEPRKLPRREKIKERGLIVPCDLPDDKMRGIS
jgi:hypothetical protein